MTVKSEYGQPTSSKWYSKCVHGSVTNLFKKGDKCPTCDEFDSRPRRENIESTLDDVLSRLDSSMDDSDFQ